MFDDTKTYQIPVPARVGTGAMLHIRWPTDEEWCARAKGRRMIQRKMGRGRTQLSPPDPGEHDLKLYAEICVNGSPEITAGEAMMLLDAIGTCTVTDVHVEDNEAVVSLQIVTGEVTHRLKMPTADQVINFRRAAYFHMELPHNQTEIRLNPAHGATVWDACGGHSLDYKGAIPCIHKDQAIKGVVEFIDANLGPRLDDANF